MKRLLQAALAVAAIATPCAAQEPATEPWPIRHVELRRFIEAYREDLTAREQTLQRETQVLRHLTRAATALLSPQTQFALSEARRSLTEAKNIATPYPPLENPIPDVLERAERILHPEFPEPQENTRIKLVLTIRTLEDYVLGKVEETSNERDALTTLTDQARGVVNGLDRQALLGIRALQHVRREVLRTK